jgi:hypothetical protein
MSRYATKRTSRRMKGSEEDKNKWYKCWNCGFPYDSSKVSTGDRSNISHEDCYIPSETEPENKILFIEKINMAGTLMLNGADGNPITDYYTPRKAVVTSGCAFCGCRNLP